MTKQTAPSPNFFREVIAELKKVSWPTRQEATRLTMIIIAATLISGMAIGLLDYLLAQTLSAIV
ncbi:preprotein translocase subunit SecE [Candidatus Wirthbacteria bacterium CG2_30_54_11]|uniref:Protein translocase subunit SecE n=1 Tax=Candidatus Wirthbacteria bacterium CG2_30_54_11 TaxID=1817892 RepID=A0A1J5IRY9_9BACT|nr:MAG: preprotein translocase subunit SecE [Candidatus Wirthbacteria bacterium CG2_30_54_11]